MAEPAKDVKEGIATRQRSPTVAITLLAVNTALVTVTTFFAKIPISQVPGQIFNFGDIMIFIAAWTFGPRIGGFSGGVGSALSDALTGGVYAPFTLVIKGTEGFLAGHLLQRGSRHAMMTSWVLASLAMVGGYFLTNALFIGLVFGTSSEFNPGLVLASYEVPFDIAQVLAGGLIGRSVSKYLRNALRSIVFPGRQLSQANGK